MFSVRSLHYMMLRYDLAKSPGTWRRGPIYVRDEERESIVYEGPEYSLVPGLMDELIGQLSDGRHGGQAIEGPRLGP